MSPFKTQAMLLYGDAIFRQNDATRARNVFVSIYTKAQTAADRAIALKKIAAVNRSMNRPDTEGLPN